MNVYDTRLDSFYNSSAKWPHSRKLAENLALCGFYLVRNGRAPDTVRCFLCNVELSGWKRSSDAKKRHAKASPNCAWVVLQYPDGTRMLETTDDTLPRSQDMRTARLWTFSKNAYWPPASYNKNRLPAQTKLADAGFYFSPTLDAPIKVTCPYCLVSITKMDRSTNLVKKHEELSPDCPFFQFTPSTRRSERRMGSSTPKDNNNNTTTAYSGIKRKSSAVDDSTAVPAAKAPTRPRSGRLTSGRRRTRADDDVSTKRPSSSSSSSIPSTTRNIVTQSNRALSQPKTRSSDNTNRHRVDKDDTGSSSKREDGSAANNKKPSLDDSIWDIGKTYKKKEAARAHNPHTYSKKDRARNAPILPDTFRNFINESSQSRDPTPEPAVENTNHQNPSTSTPKAPSPEPETTPIQQPSTRNDSDVFVKPADIKRKEPSSQGSSSQSSLDDTTTHFDNQNDHLQHLLFRTSTPHAHSFWDDDDNDASALANMTFSPIRPRDFSIQSTLINTPRTTDTRLQPISTPAASTNTREEHETYMRERLRRLEPPTSPTLSHTKPSPAAPTTSSLENESQQKHVDLFDEPSISDSTTGMTPEELDLSVDQFYMNLFQENARPLQCLGEELASALETQVNEMINVNDENDNSTSMND